MKSKVDNLLWLHQQDPSMIRFLLEQHILNEEYRYSPVLRTATQFRVGSLILNVEKLTVSLN